MFFKTVLKAFRNVHLQGVLTGKRVGRYLNGGCEAKEVCHFFQKKIVDNFGSFEKKTTFALAIGKMMNGCRSNAEIAQLVEHNLAKVRVASSSLVFRSSKRKELREKTMPRWRNGRRARFRCVCREACRFDSCPGHQNPVRVSSDGVLLFPYKASSLTNAILRHTPSHCPTTLLFSG